MFLMALELWLRKESACSEKGVAAGFAAAAVQAAAFACYSAKW